MASSTVRPRTFVVKRHTKAIDSTDTDFNDNFARHVLSAGLPLQTGRELIAAMRQSTHFAAVRVFLAGDGIHLPKGNVERDLRFVVFAAPKQGQNSVLGVMGPDVNSANTFLQVLAWDDEVGAFNFYFRYHPGDEPVPGAAYGEWLFNGRSWDAFSSDAAGAGPFDGHVNGSVVMKERAKPWLHWHSQSAGASPAAEEDVRQSLISLGGTDTIPTNVLSGAEDLQVSLEALMTKWNRARVAALRERRVPAAVASGALRAVLAQLLTTTTIELASSTTQAANNTDDVAVPIVHLYDSDAFQVLGLRPAPGVSTALTLKRAKYDEAVARFDLRLVGDSRTGELKYERPGDAHFALAAPVRAFDDVVLLRELLRNSSVNAPLGSKPLLSRRTLRAALAVDFPNPVYSARRAALIKFAPDGEDGDWVAFEAGFVAAVRAAAAVADGSAEGSAAAEFMRWYDAGNDEAQAAAIGAALAAYMTALDERLATDTGVSDLFEVLETRRRRYLGSGLNEFKLTLPFARQGQAAGKLQPMFMTPDSTAECRAEEPLQRPGGNQFSAAGTCGSSGRGRGRRCGHVLPS